MAHNRKMDSPPPEFSKVYVSGGFGLTEDDWHQLFSPFGNINEVIIVKNRDTGKEKGVVYIKYQKTSEACLAVEEMNGKTAPNSIRTLKVEIARGKKDSLEIDYDHCDDATMLIRLFVLCDRSLTQGDLSEYFGQWGKVTWVTILKNKQTNESRGLAFVKFSKQSEAARAFEECDPSYKARWADVRVRDPHDESPYNRFSKERAGEGGYGGEPEVGENAFYERLYGFTEADLESMPGFEPFDENQFGPDKLEATTPPGMSQAQVQNLFDLAPGLESCTLDTRTGIATIKYTSPKCAAYAKEKIEGMDYAGHAIEVKFAKVSGTSELQMYANELKKTMDTMLQNGTSDTARLSSIMESLKQVTQAMKIQGVSDTYDESSGSEKLPWCTARLPPRKPMASPTAFVEARLFIVCVPEAFYDKIMQNVLSRFGDLVKFNFQKGKRFGFAHFASKESADKAKRTLHGASILNNRLKVEYASSPKLSADEEPISDAKRPRHW